MDLFESASRSESKGQRPLAEFLRPETLEGLHVSQRTRTQLHLILKNITSTGRLPNLILWGPPGTGKTTLALILAGQLKNTRFLQVNAIDAGAKKLKEIGSKARDELKIMNTPTVLFIDEIHRLNKSQQDILLPFTEAGHLSLIGATTENPGYELNAALLSRSRVINLEPHSRESLMGILHQLERVLKIDISKAYTSDALDYLFQYADGDARKFINAVEQTLPLAEEQALTEKKLISSLEQNSFHFDKSSDQHYDTVSAFIKSIRGSDPDAAVYYLARMIAGGEDPKFIARRLVILASEDIGNADPRALTLATSGFLAVEKVGLPEAAINLSQVTCYLASCPKSNRAYEAWKRAQNLVMKTGHLPIPKSLRSSQTKFAKDQGYGKGYKYSHEGGKGFVDQEFMPQQISGTKLYEPSNRGFEKNIMEYLKWMKE